MYSEMIFGFAGRKKSHQILLERQSQRSDTQRKARKYRLKAVTITELLFFYSLSGKIYFFQAKSMLAYKLTLINYKLSTT